MGREGHVGVTVFFVLSGFLITARYYEPLARGEVSLAEYFQKRAARILPLYWMVLASSLLLSGRGSSLLSAETLAEWSLTHGLFARSIHHLSVPTSWTLTLEEAFYALAPLVFLTLRRFRAPAAITLAGYSLVLAALGVLCLASVDRERFGFLGSAQEVVTHTIFGRFPDFAIGIGAALLWLSGRPARWWQRPRGPLLASVGALAGAALVVLAEVAMHSAGGAEGPAWSRAWPWNGLVALGSGLVIVCLTARDSPVARLLGFPLFVYMGRISYALYLVQMTPLGKGLLYRLIPGDHPWFVPLLYVGMNLVSAGLYEVVEEPGRRAMTRLFARGHDAPGPDRAPLISTRIAALAALVGFTVAATLGAGAVLDRRGPMALAEVLRVLGHGSSRVLLVSLAESSGTRVRVPLPSAWMLGVDPDRRAPPSLLVFAGGVPVPFVGASATAEMPEAPVAYYRRPRAEFLEIHHPAGLPADLAVIRHDPWTTLELQGARLRRTPWLLALWAMALLGAGALTLHKLGRLASPGSTRTAA